MLADAEYLAVNVGRESPEQEQELIDLSYFTEKEKEAIRNVIKKDVMLNKESLCSLEIAIYDGREDQNDRSQGNVKPYGRGVCYCCGSVFYTVCDRLKSRRCVQCKHPTCERCTKKAKKQKFCTVCYRERFFSLQSSEVQLLQSRDLKQFSVSQMFGSYLLQLSLEDAKKKVRTVTLPGKSTTTDQSLAVPAGSKSRDRINTTPAAVLAKGRRKKIPSVLPKRSEDHTSSKGMESGRSVPSIEDPNSGFKLLKASDNEENLAEISSLYSEPCYDSSINISGTLKFGVWYRDGEQILYVRIKKAKGLVKIPGKDLNPYVKVHLLPDKSKHTKRKTGIQRKTNNPDFDEIVKYKVSREELASNTLWMSVWDWDMNGPNKFLGEVTLPLVSSDLDLSNSKDVKYALREHEEDETLAESDNTAPCGRICIALKFELISVSESRKRLSKSPTPLPQSMSSSLNLSSADGHEHEIRRHSTKSNTLEVQQTSARKGMSSIGKSASVDTPSDGFRETPLSPLHDPSVSDPMLSESKRSLMVPGTGSISSLKRGSAILGKLRIHIRSAEGLPSMDSTGDTNPFVRCFLLPNTSLGGKRKSTVSERTLDPVWEEEFTYNMVKVEDLAGSRALEVSVWDMDRRGTNSFIGAIRLGPEPHPLDSSEGLDWMDSDGDEVSQWEKMLTSPGEWVEYWHNLRPSLKSLHDVHRTKRGEDVGDTEPPDVGEAPQSIEETDLEGVGGKLTTLPKLLELNVNRRAKGAHYEISGDVALGLSYANQKLSVKVFRAQGLAAVSKKISDPYVKLYLLPDTHSKRKTKIVKKTLNPTYNQTIKYKIPASDLKDSSLWVTVWSHEGLFQHNQFLGEICIPFDTYEFASPMQETYYKLSDYSTLDMIPNPNLKRRQSTIYRVRTNVPERRTGVPTLYDSSTDLRATGEERVVSDGGGPAVSDGVDPTIPSKDDKGFVLPVINVEMEDLKNENDKELNSEKAASPVDITQSPISTPEQLTSRSSSSASQTKDGARITASGTRSPKTPTTKSKSSHSQAKKHSATSTPKAKYHTVSASTRPSKMGKIVQSSQPQSATKGEVKKQKSDSSLKEHLI